MGKYLKYIFLVIVSVAFEVYAMIITPILPLFAKPRFGKTNNANSEGIEPRLKEGSWFMTIDNSLWGDQGWQTEHCPNYKSYWGQVKWLWRNSAYGYKWLKLSCVVSPDTLKWEGNIHITRNHGGIFGTFRATMGKYWQWKRITPIGKTGYCVMVNFGWLLDSYVDDPTLYLTQPRALFMFSPRIVKIK